MTPVSDQDLEQVQAQFQALVLPHLDRLLGFASRRTRSAAEAEDAVQEACVRAWLGFSGLRDPAKVRPWLYCILRAVLADNCERDGRRQRLVSITRLEDEHEALVGGDDDAVLVEVEGRLTTEVIRAWHGHLKEGKYVYVVRGAAILGAVRLDDVKNPGRQTPVQRFVLSDQKPDHRRLPGSRRADQKHEVAVRYHEVDVAERFSAGLVPLPDMLEADDRPSCKVRC